MRYIPCTNTRRLRRKIKPMVLLPPANEVCVGYVFTLVCLFRGGSTWAVTPSRTGTPPGRYTPGRFIPWAGTPPGRYTPWAGTPPGQVHLLGRYTPPPPWAGTPSQAGTSPGAVRAGRYGKQAGGTHVSNKINFLKKI